MSKLIHLLIVAGLLILCLRECALTECEKPTDATKVYDVAAISGHETDECTFHDDIKWLLERGVSEETLIASLERCKNPKYKRGDFLLSKKNSNCTIQINGNHVYYPRQSNDVSTIYEVQEHCRGLIRQIPDLLEDEIRRAYRPK